MCACWPGLLEAVCDEEGEARRERAAREEGRREGERRRRRRRSRPTSPPDDGCLGFARLGRTFSRRSVSRETPAVKTPTPTSWGQGWPRHTCSTAPPPRHPPRSRVSAAPTAAPAPPPLAAPTSPPSSRSPLPRPPLLTPQQRTTDTHNDPKRSIETQPPFPHPTSREPQNQQSRLQRKPNKHTRPLLLQ